MPVASSPSLGEFGLIARYFTFPTAHTDLGVGDDAALMRVSPGHQLVASVDTLVSGRHFFANTDPWGLGWKTLAVSVSDLAAMGACPRWALLSLSLPTPDASFLSGLSAGLNACATAFGIDLAGGDTTQGPLATSLTLLGEIRQNQAILRRGACIGDDLWVSGQPGRAALGLHVLQGRLRLPEPFCRECIHALERPQPRLALGQHLSGLATAMLDVSDGLLGDLGHLLLQSGVWAEVDEALLPMAALVNGGGLSQETARTALLYGGDDYELLFTAAPQHRPALHALAHRLGVALHRIGRCVPHTGQTTLPLHRLDGGIDACPLRGHDHFLTEPESAVRP